ncbi:MAG: hypothetical protein ABR570_09980 [Burkholderiales bacterium]
MIKSPLRLAVALALHAAALSGCYVLPVSSKDIEKLEALMQQANAQRAANQAPTPAPARPTSVAPAAVPAPEAPAAPSAPAAPMVIQARLYPMNEIATENGMVSGSVTNMMNGKGRLQVSYRGEQLVGEATRVANDQSKGVASAWGPNGSFMSCEYQMSSPLRGAGTCSFSDGARYQVHVGN